MSGQIREFGGLALIAMGVIGILIPVLPSTPFFLAAVALLGTDHPRIRPWLKRLERWRNSDGKASSCDRDSQAKS
jgi:uncharacterized membrane protein YbaN (DUF454 family)